MKWANLRFDLFKSHVYNSSTEHVGSIAWMMSCAINDVTLLPVHAEPIRRQRNTLTLEISAARSSAANFFNRRLA